MASTLFKKVSLIFYENSLRHFCSSVERLHIKKGSKVFFYIYESELRKVNRQAHKIFHFDETGITTVRHTHSKVFSMRGKKKWPL
jgi:hypothetical protein